MATYYGYAERNAEDQIDWNAVGKSMTDTLNAEQKRRDDLKAEIDKDSFEYGQTLSNSPQGEHKGMNEYSLNYAADAQDYNLMQLRLLKSGKIKLRDYLKGRENIKQGTTQIFDMMSKYQEKYGEYAERAKTDVSGIYEGFLLGEVEGFGNLTSTMPYINPTTGKVSIGKKVPKDPSKPYDANTNPYTVKMSDNPSDFRTVQELNFALSSQVDRFDSAGAVDRIVDNFAKKFDTLTKSGSASTKIDDVRNMPDFKKSLDDMIIAEFESNPLNALSALGDFIKYGPDGELIKLTRNPEEQDEHTLLLVPNPEQPEGGIAMPDFESESGKKLLEHMREKIAESVDAGLNRTIEYQRAYKYTPPTKPSGSGKVEVEKKADELYQLERKKLISQLDAVEEGKPIDGFRELRKWGGLFNVPIKKGSINVGTDDAPKLEERIMVGSGDKMEILDTSTSFEDILFVAESQVTGTNINNAYRKRGDAATSFNKTKSKNKSGVGSKY